jgi:hypothetical protein
MPEKHELIDERTTQINTGIRDAELSWGEIALERRDGTGGRHCPLLNRTCAFYFIS